MPQTLGLQVDRVSPPVTPDGGQGHDEIVHSLLKARADCVWDAHFGFMDQGLDFGFSDSPNPKVCRIKASFVLFFVVLPTLGV